MIVTDADQLRQAEARRFSNVSILALLLTCVFGSAALSILSRRYVIPKNLQRSQDLQSASLVENFAHQGSANRSWVDQSAKNALEAKEGHRFWLAPDEFLTGLSLKVLENPSLFQTFFPGYPEELREDAALWDRYFKSDFTSASWIYTLGQTPQTQLLTFYSWAGCFEIYKKYGADIVILGTSETLRDIPSDLLSEKLSHNVRKRILHCGIYSLNFDSMELALRELAKSKHQPEWIILGVSLWNGYLRAHQNLFFSRAKQAMLKPLQKKEVDLPFALKKVTSWPVSWSTSLDNVMSLKLF